jgi:RNA polymerase primary sigma factor
MREQVENAAGNSVEGAEPDLALNRAKEALRKPVRKASAKPEQARGAKASALDKAISQARVAGIAVSDDRLGDSQTLWIHIKEDIDGSSRQIAGELIGLGFEFEPGKGYWL